MANAWQAPEFAARLRGKFDFGGVGQRSTARDVYLWYASRGERESSPGQVPEVPVPRCRPLIPHASQLFHVILTQVRTST